MIHSVGIDAKAFNGGFCSSHTIGSNFTAIFSPFTRVNLLAVSASASSIEPRRVSVVTAVQSERTAISYFPN